MSRPGRRRRRPILLLVTAVLAAIATVGLGGAAGGRATAAEPCPTAPLAPVDHDRTNGTAAPELTAVTGEGQPYDQAGATVAVVAGDDPPHHVLTVTYRGVTTQLTTQPFVDGGHYPSRGPLPGETDAGVVRLHDEGGQVYVTLHQGSSGYAAGFAWRLPSADCGPDPAASPEPARPVPGASRYTG